MTTIAEAIDAIYDAKRGCFRDLGGEPVTADNLPRKGDFTKTPMGTPCIADDKWTAPLPGWHIIRRAEQPKPHVNSRECGGHPPGPGLESFAGADGLLYIQGCWCTNEQPKPGLIYFPWPSGIDGIIGVIGPRGDIPVRVKFRNYHSGGSISRTQSQVTKPAAQARKTLFRFPADADLQWVRDESEVPDDLLREAKERDA